MARKKKSQGFHPGVLLLLVVFILVFLTFVIAAGLVCLWLFREVAVRLRLSELTDRLVLSESDLAEIRQLKRRGGELLAQRHAIEAEGSHVPRRRDGYFNERSAMGAGLNARLMPVVEEGKRKEGLLHDLQQAPVLARAEYVQLGAGLQASRFAVLSLALVGGTIAFLGPEWADGMGTWIMNNSLWAPDIDAALFAAIMVATWLAAGVYSLARALAREAVEQSLSARLAGGVPAPDTHPEPAPDSSVADAPTVDGEDAGIEGDDTTDVAASVETSVDHPQAKETDGGSAQPTDAPADTPTPATDTSADGEGEFVPREFATGLRRDLNARYRSFAQVHDRFRMEQGTVWLVLPGDGSEWFLMGRDEAGYHLDIRSYDSARVPALGDLMCDRLGWQRGEKLDDYSYRFFARAATDAGAEDAYRSELFERLDELAEPHTRLAELCESVGA
ncbi:MAG: hypothetical protein F4X40_05450 [Chloroflexi bacterium]|nr:hypothetical protein [Chloroflexota bacterium]